MSMTPTSRFRSSRQSWTTVLLACLGAFCIFMVYSGLSYHTRDSGDGFQADARMLELLRKLSAENQEMSEELGRLRRSTVETNQRLSASDRDALSLLEHANKTMQSLHGTLSALPGDVGLKETQLHKEMVSSGYSPKYVAAYTETLVDRLRDSMATLRRENDKLKTTLISTPTSDAVASGDGTSWKLMDTYDITCTDHAESDPKCRAVWEGSWIPNGTRWFPTECQDHFYPFFDIGRLRAKGYQWILYLGDSLTRHLYQYYLRAVSRVDKADFVYNKKYYDDRNLMCDEPSERHVLDCETFSRGCSLTHSSQPCGNLNDSSIEFMEAAMSKPIDAGKFVVSWKWASRMGDVKALAGMIREYHAKHGRAPDAIVVNTGLHQLLSKVSFDKFEEAYRVGVCELLNLPGNPHIIIHGTSSVVREKLPAHKRHIWNSDVQKLNKIAESILDPFISLKEDVRLDYVPIYPISEQRPNSPDGIHYDQHYDRAVSLVDLNLMYRSSKTRRNEKMRSFKNVLDDWANKNSCGSL